jgi:hypothetical protein
MRWRLADGLLWRAWEDEIVVYDDRSGDTHRLTAPSASVFLSLQTPTPADRAAAEPDELHAEILDGLARLGLVEPRA